MFITLSTSSVCRSSLRRTAWQTSLLSASSFLFFSCYHWHVADVGGMVKRTPIMVKMQLYRLQSFVRWFISYWVGWQHHVTARPGTQTTVLLQWVMGDVWYQDNLEYLSDLLTPYPLPPPFYCIFGVYIFFTF